MAKTVSAEFDSVDMAELAARNVRYKFEGISKIKIKYRSIEDNSYLVLPSASAMNGTLGLDYPQSYGAIAFDGEEHTEADENRSSRLLIEASDHSSARIASYLRGLGGIGIKVTDVQ